MHYTQQDRARLSKELGIKGAVFGLIFAAYVAFCAYCLSARLQLVCQLVSLVGLAAYFFFFSVYLLPPLRYRRFLKDVFEARRHERELTFVRVEPDLDVREGLRFHPVIVLDDEGFEHRLYWDERKPLTELTPGQPVRLTVFGQVIVAMD